MGPGSPVRGLRLFGECGAIVIDETPHLGKRDASYGGSRRQTFGVGRRSEGRLSRVMTGAPCSALNCPGIYN
jgi:hypothetical protein